MAYTYQPYKESDSLTKLRKSIEENRANKPQYTSRWQQELEGTLAELKGRGPFTYDPNSDPMYGAYRDRYTREGKLAMEDAQGKAAALTGGYGSSYGQQVGQQTYGAYLQGLGEQMQTLYGLALDTYTREGEALQDQYRILGEQEDREYDRYLDSLEGWVTEQDYLADRYDSQLNFEYGQWADQRDFGYRQERDQVADDQWQTEFNYRTAKDAMAGSAGSSAGGSGSSGRSATSSTKTSAGSQSSEKQADPVSMLEKTLAWVQSSGSSDSVKERQIRSTVEESLARGEITANQAQSLVDAYSGKKKTAAIGLPGSSVATRVDLRG